MDPDRYEYYPETVSTDHYKSDEYQRVAVYARVSTDDVRQTSSFELQKRYYEDFVARHAKWELVEIYADEGISGTSTAHRDAFNRMIADAKAGKIEISLRKWIQTHYCEPGHKPHEIRHFTVVACFFYGKSGCYQTVEFGLPM